MEINKNKFPSSDEIRATDKLLDFDWPHGHQGTALIG